MGLLDIIGIIALIVFTASVVAALTPTPSDEKWLGKAYKWTIDLCALNIGKAKELAQQKAKE